jgi:hypothetical protein
MIVAVSVPEYDGSDGEGDPNYYHRYRDILDEEENENDSDAERSDEDVISKCSV